MFCIHCGTPFDPYATACLQCGKLRATPPPRTATARTPAASIHADPQMRWLLPVGRSFYAIAAGYLGLLSMVPILAQLAVVCGVLGLRDIRRHPEKGGSGRAWFGIVAGGFFTVLTIIILLR